MINNIQDIIAWKYKGVKCQCGETYESLEWFSQDIQKPGFEDIEKADKEYSAYKDMIAYREKRAAEYPSIPDQLDLLYHEGLEGWKSVIRAVKDKYLK